MRYILLLAALGIPVSPASTAEVELRGTTLYLRNDLVEGDLSRVRKAMRRAREAHQRVSTIVLDSEGGDGDTGLLLAEWIAKNNLNVLITDRCWSACAFSALVALGRGTLEVSPGAEIGVHQVYDTDSGTPNKPWTIAAANRLSRLGAPQGPLDAMVGTDANLLTVYDSDDLIRMGAGTGD